MATPNDFTYWYEGKYTDPTGQDWGDTQYGDMTREQAPQAAYYRYGVNLGIPDDNSAYSQWFKQQYPDVYTGYQAATISNPYLLINDYLNSLGGQSDWLRRFMDLAPQLRGENQARAGAGTVRFINR